MAHDIAPATPQPVHMPVAHDIAPAKPQSLARPRGAWIVPTGLAAAAAWAAGWASGVSWAWGGVTPRHRRHTHLHT